MPSFPNPVPVAATQDVRTDTNKVGLGLDKYLYASGLVKPEHRKMLSIQQPQYLNVLTAIMERMGRSTSIANQSWTWSEQDRTRRAATITNASTAGSATRTLTLDTTTDEPYWIAGDVVYSESNTAFIVDSIGTSTTFQTIVVSKQGGGNIADADVANGEKIGHGGSAFGEGTNQPDGRIFLPDEFGNNMQIIKRTAVLTRNSIHNAYWVDSLMDAYYFKENSILELEFAKDREIEYMFNKKSAVGATRMTGDGWVRRVLSGTGSVLNTFSGAIQEADLQEHITDLVISSPATEFLVLAGAYLFADAHRALKGYFLAGAVDYGVFGKVNKVGLELRQYVFFGKTITFVHYPLFDDIAVQPYRGIGSSTKINFSNFSLWLNMGNDTNGDPLVAMKHFTGSELIYAIEPGMVGGKTGGTFGGVVSSGFDGMKIYLESEGGPEIRNLKSHGALWQVG